MATRVSKKVALASCGTKLKPGFKYLKGGIIVKVTPKKTTAKKTTARGKLGAPVGGTKMVCQRREPDGSTVQYSAQSSNPNNACPYGGKLVKLNNATGATASLGRPKAKAKAKPRTKKR